MTTELPARAEALEMLHQMIRVRRFEERCAELYTRGDIRGFLHLYIGQEATAVGAVAALEPGDDIVATYREHGHALVRGLSMREVMAEMFGKSEGCSGGRGGSMHLFSAAHRFYGGHAIVGGGLPTAAGLALAHRMRGERAITAAFFGEGAAAEGEFHESLNLAALWGLPVLFLCENNGYAMGTALIRSESQIDLCAKARSYDVDAERADGMDVVDVRAAVRRALASIRDGGGPRFLECRTYRFRAHSMFDPELYRPRREVEEWRLRDPIPNFRRRLLEAGMIGDGEVAAMEQRVAAEIADAVAYAEAGSWEPVEELTRHVTAERGHR